MSLRYILMLKDVCDNEYQLVRPICIRSRVKLIRNDHKEMKELRTFFFILSDMKATPFSGLMRKRQFSKYVPPTLFQPAP
jgi:hypothetical protein